MLSQMDIIRKSKGKKYGVKSRKMLGYFKTMTMCRAAIAAVITPLWMVRMMRRSSRVFVAAKKSVLDFENCGVQHETIIQDHGGHTCYIHQGCCNAEIANETGDQPQLS
jgi:hypothetical protein